jgi:hypothetical protein
MLKGPAGAGEGADSDSGLDLARIERSFETEKRKAPEASVNLMIACAPHLARTTRSAGPLLRLRAQAMRSDVKNAGRALHDGSAVLNGVCACPAGLCCRPCYGECWRVGSSASPE